MTTYGCPVECGGGPFSTENGAVMHAINKTDETHADMTDKTTAYARLEGGENQEAADESVDLSEDETADDLDDAGDGTVGADSADGLATPEIPTAPDGPNADPVGADAPEPDGADDLDDPTEDGPDPETTTPEDSDPSGGAGVGVAVVAVLVGGVAALLIGGRGGSQTDDAPDFEVV